MITQRGRSILRICPNSVIFSRFVYLKPLCKAQHAMPILSVRDTSVKERNRWFCPSAAPSTTIRRHSMFPLIVTLSQSIVIQKKEEISPSKQINSCAHASTDITSPFLCFFVTNFCNPRRNAFPRISVTLPRHCTTAGQLNGNYLVSVICHSNDQD